MAVTNPADSYNAGLDANGMPTLTALSGTAGTADTTGTAEIFALGGNPTTGAQYFEMIAGTLNLGTMTNTGTNVNVVTGSITAGTITRVSTIGTLEVGTMTNTGTNINVITGTVQNVGTVSAIAGGTLGALAAGTITTGTVSVTIGTIVGPVASGGSETGAPVPIGGTDSGGTVRLPLVTSAGYLNDIIQNGTVTNLSTGTLNALASGTITGGTLTNLVSGTVTALAVGTIGGKAASGAAAVANPVQIAGTDSGGTIYSPLVTTGGILSANVNTGTINVGTVVIPTGTITTIAAGTQNTLGTVGVVNNIVTGTLAALTTVTTVSNLTNGSVNLLTGTVTRVSNVGTLESGTVQKSNLPVQIGTSYGTLGTTGALVWGTLIAASGAGTYQYISGVSMVVQSGTVDVAITNVGTVATVGGAGILARGNFPAGAGITKAFDPIMRSGTNGTLAYYLGGAGSVWFDVQYWQGV